MSREILDCNSHGFIARYFKTSRLHHLSTWKLDLADFVSKELILRGKSQPFHSSKQIIMHIDMDCFFASVGIRDRPELKCLPVAVAHSVGGMALDYSTSEIASCNYVAREKGIKNGSFLGSAKQLAPNLVVIPYEFEKYDECSKALYTVLLDHASFVQSVSCDEAYIDATSMIVELMKKNNMGVEEAAHEIANMLRGLIFSATGGCCASVGVASNMLLARIATAKAKPDGIHSLLDHQKIKECLRDLPIRNLPGIGHSTSDKCSELGLVTCGDVNDQLNERQTDRQPLVLTNLKKALGQKAGETLFQFCLGLDDRTLENKERQSLGSDINWGIRFKEQTQVDRFLMEFCEEVCARLEKLDLVARHVTVTAKKKLYEGEPTKFLGCGHCTDLSRSFVPGSSIDSKEQLYVVVHQLYNEIGLTPTDVRGLGIHLKNLLPRSGERVISANSTTQKTLTSFFQGKTAKPEKLAPMESKVPVADNVVSCAPSPSAITERTSPKFNSSSVSSQSFSYGDIDLDVLVELPTDIQRELQNHFHATSGAVNRPQIESKSETTYAVGAKRGACHVEKGDRKGNDLKRSAPNPGTNTQSKSAASLMAYLKGDTNIKLTTTMEPPPGVDMEVWQSLPEDVRREQLLMYKL